MLKNIKTQLYTKKYKKGKYAHPPTQPTTQKDGDYGMGRKVLKIEFQIIQEKAFPNSGTQAGCSNELSFGV